MRRLPVVLTGLALGGALAVALQAGVSAASAVPVVKVGVTRGTHAEILDEVQRVAATRGMRIDVVRFDDSTRIDAALAAHQIDAASFEDEPAFDAARTQHGYPLSNVATTITLPMALYSRKLTTLAQIQPGATVAIPADPEGMARALILLQNYTLLTFDDRAGLHAKLRDVTSNRLHLNLRALPRERLYASLNTVTFAVIDSVTAEQAGLFPARDSIGIEDARSPFASVLTVRDSDRAQAWVAQLVAAYHSDDVARFILTRYQDSVRRPW
ncbi:MetQ/NlpA family lipoprotein [Paraburkholderia sp.]|uniref:MetQ/NlpA family lipoprotein n=1 Tax=Paraburkholderia sp. TaxID=1926495 RepID=UPI00239A0AE0|nr:MetQ/NlpA family lipoprotein [Paraburkholderia sp.]MDE1182222.1 MetQ/NlpA family lipoprotein [Paraburkholderia sp.]